MSLNESLREIKKGLINPKKQIDSTAPEDFRWS